MAARYFTPQQAAERLGINYRRFCGLLNHKIIGYRQDGPRTRRIPEAELERYERQRMVGSAV